MEREVQRPARWHLQGVVNDEAAVCLRPLREDVAAKLTGIRAADQASPEYQPARSERGSLDKGPA